MDIRDCAAIPLPPSPPPKTSDLPSDNLDAHIATLPHDLPSEKPSDSPSTSEASSSSAMASSISSTRTSLTSSEPDDSTHTQSDPNKPLGILLLRPPPLPRSASTPSVSVSVTFAPLPTLEPRRRTSSVQLGIAARSQMLRARRIRVMGDTIEGVQHIPGEGISHVQYAAVREDEEHPTQDQPMHSHPHAGKRYQKQRAYVWDEEADDEVRGTASRRPSAPKWGPSGGGSADEADDYDALLALGRMMRGGAKTLWRSFSSSHNKEKSKAGVDTRKDAERDAASGDETETERETRRRRRRSSSDPGRPSDPEQSMTVRVLVNEPGHLFEERSKSLEAVKESLPAPIEAEEEEGKVWEEEIDDDALRRRMQTVPSAQAEGKERPGLVGRFSSLRVSKSVKTRLR